jgi:hypothetical protein
MTSIIIDSKYDDKRISVSITPLVFDLFTCSFDNSLLVLTGSNVESALRAKATSVIRDAISSGEIANSKQAREYILERIVDTSLLKTYSSIYQNK